MKDYWIKTTKGAFRSVSGEIIYFSNVTEAREAAIAYCDQSDPLLEIRNKNQDLLDVLEVET
jgi:hypothetical protein